MHFISINVLLAQDQKHGANLNFLMKVISTAFIPILGVVVAIPLEEWCLFGEMFRPREKKIDGNF